MFALDQGRYTVAAGATGLIRACRDASAKYALQRRTFGQAIAEHQLVKQMIAHMESDYQVSRLLWLRAGYLKNSGLRNTRETGLAKWYSTVASERAAGDAVQVHGANGYSDEYPVGRFYRNCKGAVIYEGTREVHTLMQADYVLGFARTSRRAAAAGVAWASGDGRHSSFHSSMDSDLSLDFLRVVEQAAIAWPFTMGQGDRHGPTGGGGGNAPRLGAVPIDGTIVIGEGERDGVLFIGEKIGLANVVNGRGGLGAPRSTSRLTLATRTSVRPVRRVRLPCSRRRRRAGCSRAGPLHGLIVRARPGQGGSRRAGHDLMRLPSRSARRRRPRHHGARSAPPREAHRGHSRDGRAHQLIGDGDLSAAIVAAVAGTGVHAVMGTGGAPEGVLTAVAMRCLNGEIYARLVVRTPEDEARSHAMGITDLRRVYTAADLAPGRHLIFAATGVTEGALMKGDSSATDADRIARDADLAAPDPSSTPSTSLKPTTSRSVSDAMGQVSTSGLDADARTLALWRRNSPRWSPRSSSDSPGSRW
jgi:hypothetical protein